jgi:hypothetical protein
MAYRPWLVEGYDLYKVPNFQVVADHNKNLPRVGSAK